ncbi:MAG: hypothetical protein JWR19_2251, partial [Pedosphaera sp.]|nr:hypothetical protein [Pedosphaera sp.]
RDAALGAYASHVANNDPADSVQWAQKIQDPAQRANTLENTARLWLAADPTAAQPWIAKSSLPDEIKIRLLNPNAAN